MNDRFISLASAANLLLGIFLASDLVFAEEKPVQTPPQATADDALYLRATVEPVDLRQGPQLFTDMRLIAESSGLSKDPAARQSQASNQAAVYWRTQGAASGRLLTAPLWVRAGTESYLTVDARAAGGKIRVQVRDSLGRVIPGYGWEDTHPITTDGAATPLQIKISPAYRKPDEIKNLDFARLDGQTVRLEFELTSAAVGGFNLIRGDELPLRLGDGPHLFIDDYLIAQQKGLRAVQHAPQRLDRPMIVKSRVGEERIIATGGTIQYDPARDKFRFWNYESGPTKDRQHWYHRESDDPMGPWPLEGKLLLHFDGFATGVFDDGPDAADPARRYRIMPFMVGTAPWGPWLYFSADGLNWQPYEANPILPPFLTGDPSGTPPAPEGASDILDPFWDPIRHRYGLLAKSMSSNQLFQNGPQKGQPMRSRTAEGCVRTSCQMIGDDGIHWTRPWQVFEPDHQDIGVFEFYGGHVVPIGDLLVSYVRILRDDLGGEGTGYTVLATSRDGAYWTRLREPWLDYAKAEQAHDNAFAWVMSSTVKGERRYFSYTGYNKGHKTGDRQSGLAWLDGDRYVSRAASGQTEGVLRTPLMRYTGGAAAGLSVNAEGGGITVRVLDKAGQTIPGFDAGKVEPGRSLSRPVKFQKSLAELGDVPLRLEFVLRDAALYGFSFEKAN